MLTGNIMAEQLIASARQILIAYWESLLLHLLHFPVNKVGCPVLEEPFPSLFYKNIFVDCVQCCLHFLVVLLCDQNDTAIACGFCFVALQFNRLLSVLMIHSMEAGKETRKSLF